ncbi:hypothetical protein HRI_003806700 [Hibiscus trionum]|uniref:RING-type E3 ubiquitin transferase n=1 Tax=Hibiscus trionum TaxID=183268 RepID=A0A9W7MIT3_HIBTR|nr:hypothetical protein HRI_003806700 [Hibiscus trionum]
MAFKIVWQNSQVVQITPHHRQIPPGSIQIVLSVNVGYITAANANPFFSQRTLCFRLNLLQSPRLLHQVLAPKLEELRVDMSSDEYEGVLQDIMQCGIGTVRRMRDQGHYCRALQLHSDLYVAPMAMAMSDQETSMTRALSESRREFENNNYGMVAAAESSVKKMVKRVKVEDGEKGDCMVCLEELRVGFEASQMPCSHVFHGGCIQRWLKQSHYCPICRFEMPTD